MGQGKPEDEVGYGSLVLELLLPADLCSKAPSRPARTVRRGPSAGRGSPGPQEGKEGKGSPGGDTSSLGGGLFS